MALNLTVDAANGKLLNETNIDDIHTDSHRVRTTASADGALGKNCRTGRSVLERAQAWSAEEQLQVHRCPVAIVYVDQHVLR